MAWRELVTYEWSCDRCGETDGDDVDEIPAGWTTDGDAHYCEGCS